MIKSNEKFINLESIAMRTIAQFAKSRADIAIQLDDLGYDASQKSIQIFIDMMIDMIADDDEMINEDIRLDASFIDLPVDDDAQCDLFDIMQNIIARMQ